MRLVYTVNPNYCFFSPSEEVRFFSSKVVCVCVWCVCVCVSVYSRSSETKLHVLLQCLPYFSFSVRNIVLQDICAVSTTYPDKRHYLHSTSTTLWYYASENTVSCFHSCQTQDVIRKKITCNLCSYIR
jgi:hypothetical protein